MQTFWTVLVYLLRLLGAVLIYVSVFTYEDEDRRIQDRVERWWIRLSDKQRESRSRVAAFMQEVARLTGEGLDGLFGRRLLSVRFVVVSIYLSLASFFLLILVIWGRIQKTGGVTRSGAFFWLLYFLALALGPAFIHNKYFMAIWWSVIPAVLITISGFLVFVY